MEGNPTGFDGENVLRALGAVGSGKGVTLGLVGWEGKGS